MPEENKDKQDRMIELLEEMLKWMKVTSIPQVKKLLLDILPSDREKIAYHFSDGGRGSQEVAKFAAGVTFWEFIVHTSLELSGILPITILGFTLTRTINAIQIILPLTISVMLVYYIWIKK